jgi:PiT family inorganic phosphate transporter
VVGGVMGAGIAAAGLVAVNWPTMGKIDARGVITPWLGGIIAAIFLSLIKSKIIYTDNKIENARRWVPILIAIMVGAFSTYLAMKGLKKIIKIDITIALSIGLVLAVLSYFVSKPLIHKQSTGLENRNKSVKILFRIPLIFSAALLSFAHGANDVANAVGPLAAIVHSAQFDSFSTKVVIPLWVMMIGAFGISFGLFLFGPKLIRRVGSQITKLNPMRGYCIALSAAITVIIASWLGLPVSSTHIALGGVFGVGFFREWDAERRKALNLSSGKTKSLATKERHRRKLVRRSHFITILAAWVITVPCAAMISGIIYICLHNLVA